MGAFLRSSLTTLKVFLLSFLPDRVRIGVRGTVMPEHKMLSEVITYCSRCKLNLNHRIILMAGSEPARVLCLTCQSEHKFRDSQKASPTPSGLKRLVLSRSSLPPKTGTLESQWRLKLEAKDKTPKPYKIDASYALDDLVYHPNFGRGLVLEFIHPDKVQIFFDNGVKVLKGNRS
jgi:hypothetical protein